MLYDENNNYYDYIVKETNENFEFTKPNFEENNNLNFNFKNDMTFDIDNLNINNFRHNMNALRPLEGLNKGALMEGEAKPYKGHSYGIKVKGKRDEMLLEIQALNFAVRDLNLYLDLHPNETDKIELLKKYISEVEKLKIAYSKEFNPLCLEYAYGSAKFDWIDNPWPWDKGGSM